MLRLGLLIVGALLLAVVGLGVLGIAVLWWATPSAPGEPALPGTLMESELVFAGLERRWLTYLPENAREPSAIVFALHGSGQTPEHYRTMSRYRFDELAEEHGFLAVYPAGFRNNWNGCRRAQRTAAHDLDLDDAGFLLEVLARTADAHAVDLGRVYATGFSNGGQMAYRLASERPDRFAAVAALVAQVPTRDNLRCTPPLGPIPVLIMNGTADPIIPFTGGDASLYGWFSAGPVRSMEESLAYWRLANGLTVAEERQRLPDRDPDDGSTVERVVWREAHGEVVGYAVRGGGHTMPGGWQYAPAFLIGPTNGDISAPDEIWDFFQRHRRD